jgi:hypothetical protein
MKFALLSHIAVKATLSATLAAQEESRYSEPTILHDIKESKVPRQAIRPA